MNQYVTTELLCWGIIALLGVVVYFEELRKSKLIPDERYPIKASINLYGNNQISIIAFEEKLGLIIESEKIYITLKSIFEMNWEALR